MKCTTVRNHIEDYLEGRLAQLERNEFVTHVTACADCEEELLAWREMFRALREVERHEAPGRIRTAVLARLRAEGVIRRPERSTMQRVFDRFFAMPARERYPLAAALVIASLYGPLAAIVGLFRGSFDSAVAAVAELSAVAATALQSIAFVHDLTDAVAVYIRAGQTVLQALNGALGSDARMAVAMVAALMLALGIGTFTRRKRVARHATFGF